MRKRLLLLSLVLLVGCATMGGETKTFWEMTPIEKTAYAMAIYNRQYTDYMSQVGYTKGADGIWKQTSQPQLSDDQKSMLKTKKKLLSDLYLATDIYKGQMQFGGIPTKDAEQQLYDLLNKIGG
jgi:hypothetical protein